MQAIHQSGFFLKANSSIIGPSQNVVIRHPDRRTDEEVELAVVDRQARAGGAGGVKLKYKLRIAYPTPPPFFCKCSF